jgi:hypothetical protein
MQYIKSKSAFGLSMALILVSGMMTHASDAVGNDLSPIQIFEKLQENYASLTSYSDEGKIITAMSGASRTNTFTSRLARPDFYRIEWQPDGASSSYFTKNLGGQVWSAGAGNLLATETGLQNEGSQIVALDAASAFSSGASVTIPMTFFKLQWQGELDDMAFGEDRQADEKVGSVDCYVFKRELPGQTRTLWIGKQDFLLHQVRIFRSAEAMQAMMAKVMKGESPETTALLQDVTVTETHAHIIVNQPLSRSDFLPSRPHFAAANDEDN